MPSGSGASGIVVEAGRGASGRSGGPVSKPGLGEQRAMAGLAVLGEAPPARRRTRGSSRDARTRARSMVQPSSARPEAAAPVRRDRPCPRSRTRRAVADDALDPGRGHEPAVDLDQDDVVDRIRAVAVVHLDLEVLRRSAGTGSRPPGWRRRSVGQRARSPTRRAKYADREPGDRRRAGQVERCRIGPLRSSGHRSPPYLRCMCSLDRLVDDLPGAAVLGARPRVALARRPGDLALELAVAGQALLGQRPVVERGPDRAARLAVVPAIAEPARRGDVDDVVEGGLDALVGAEDLERADARACRPAAPRRAARTARDGSSCGGRASRSRGPRPSPGGPRRGGR